MAQEWTKPPEDTELHDVEQPVGSDDDLDDGGYGPQSATALGAFLQRSSG